MLRALNEVYNIKSNKLVIGLPYYGRTFQTGYDDTKMVKPETKAFSEGSFGLYQPYQYGSAYSYSDIYEKYYQDNDSKDVKTILLDKASGYTEDIVYTKSLLSQITSTMKEEMISYNSAASIKAKVTYAKEKGYGGYMCWHMLSDYYE